MNFRDILSHERLLGFVEVGAGVHNLTAGDRVVVPLTISCIGTVAERLALGGARTLHFMKDDRHGALTERTSRRPDACIDAVGLCGGLLDKTPLVRRSTRAWGSTLAKRRRSETSRRCWSGLKKAKSAPLSSSPMSA